MNQPKRILCGVDFTQCSRAALDYALMLAERCDAKVDLVHAWDLTAAVVEPRPEGPPPGAKYAEEAAARAMQELLATLPPAARARVTERIVWGQAAPIILEQAEQQSADLIVLGTQGRSWLSRLATGSVAEQVVRRAPCPVLTIRPPAGS